VKLVSGTDWLYLAGAALAGYYIVRYVGKAEKLVGDVGGALTGQGGLLSSGEGGLISSPARPFGLATDAWRDFIDFATTQYAGGRQIVFPDSHHIEPHRPPASDSHHIEPPRPPASLPEISSSWMSSPVVRAELAARAAPPAAGETTRTFFTYPASGQTLSLVTPDAATPPNFSSVTGGALYASAPTNYGIFSSSQPAAASYAQPLTASLPSAITLKNIFG